MVDNRMHGIINLIIMMITSAGLIYESFFENHFIQDQFVMIGYTCLTWIIKATVTEKGKRSGKFFHVGEWVVTFLYKSII